MEFEKDFIIPSIREAEVLANKPYAEICTPQVPVEHLSIFKEMIEERITSKAAARDELRKLPRLHDATQAALDQFVADIDVLLDAHADIVRHENPDRLMATEAVASKEL